MGFVDSIAGSNFVVFGAGVTGSSVAEFLIARGGSVHLIDEKPSKGSIPDLSSLDLMKISLGIVSPGWRHDQKFVAEVREAGIEIISEIDLAWRIKSEINPKQKWLALTGTNGKTTTVQMTEAMLQQSGVRARACGNVGDPVIQLVADTTNDFLVLELSSFQLSWSREARFVVSAILNIADDHIDWHGSFDEYARCKLSIADMSEALIANRDDLGLQAKLPLVKCRLITYSLQTPKPHEIGLVENLIVDRAFVGNDAEVLFELGDVKPAVPHNVSNAMAAAGLARAVGATAEAISAALIDFRLDHHRLELVLEKDGISWIDDSKATNPHAALASLRSQLRSIWIAGGLAKGANMDQLIQEGSTRIKFAILIGTDANLIAESLSRHAPLVEYQIVNPELKGRDLMVEVVQIALRHASSGDTVLLAPACASMDQFKNYAERGDLFSAAVKEFVDGK